MSEDQNDQGAFFSDGFVGANRRAGCKYSLKFYCRVWTVSRIVSILTLAMSRCYFEDYTFVLSYEWFANVLRFGPDTAVDKNLMFVEIFA